MIAAPRTALVDRVMQVCRTAGLDAVVHRSRFNPPAVHVVIGDTVYALTPSERAVRVETRSTQWREGAVIGYASMPERAVGALLDHAAGLPVCIR